MSWSKYSDPDGTTFSARNAHNDGCVRITIATQMADKDGSRIGPAKEGSIPRDFLSRSSCQRGPSCSLRATLPALRATHLHGHPPSNPTGGLRLHSQKSPGFADPRGRAQPPSAGCFIEYLRKVRALNCWRALVVTSL